MKKPAVILTTSIVLGLSVSARTAPPAQTSAPARPAARKLVAPPPTPASAATADTAVVKQYCSGCHSDRGKAGGLSLAAFDVAHAPEQAPVAEKMIRKLRAGMMPPPGARRPDEATLKSLADAIETRVDRAAAVKPNPGWRPFQRLNRA